LLKAQEFVAARLDDREEDVIQDALHHLLRSRGDLRVQLAIHRCDTYFVADPKAANVAGVSWAQARSMNQPRPKGIERKVSSNIDFILN